MITNFNPKMVQLARFNVLHHTLSAMVDDTEEIQTDPVCCSLVQGLQAHLGELQDRLRLLSEPISIPGKDGSGE